MNTKKLTLNDVIWVQYHSYNAKRKVVYIIWQDGIYSISRVHMSPNFHPEVIVPGVYIAVEEKNIGITAASYNR